jgi:hypothetical protein
MKPMREEDKGLISIEDQLFNIRMLIFFEASPQSNKYNQVLLTPEQFKKVSKTIEDIFPSEPAGEKVNVSIETSTEVYTLPDLKETL